MAQRRKTTRITALPTIQPTQKAVVPTYQELPPAVLNDKASRLEAIRRAKEQSGFFNARYPKKLVWVRSGMGARGEIVISRDPIGSYSYGGFKMPATIDDFIIIWRRRMNYGPKEHLSRDYIEIRKLFVATWPYYPLEFNTRRTATDGIMLLDIYNIERDMIIKVFQQMNKYLNVTYDELFTILWTETVLQIAYGGNRKSIFSAEQVDSLVLRASLEELQQIAGPDFTNKYMSTKADILLALYFNYTPLTKNSIDINKANIYLMNDTTQQKVAITAGYIGMASNWNMPPHRALAFTTYFEKVYPFILKLPIREIAQEKQDITTYAIYGEYFGLLFPPRYQLLFSVSVPDNIKDVGAYYIRNLSQYIEVITRPANIAPPNDQTNFTELYKYTDKELIDYYRVNTRYIDRENLLLVAIRNKRQNKVTWSILHAHCSNKDVPNLLTDEPREAEPNDPVLSYGVDPIYRCYNASELIGSINVEDGTFDDPDWKPGTNMERAFPADAIRALKLSLGKLLDPPRWGLPRLGKMPVEEPLPTQLPALRQLQDKLQLISGVTRKMQQDITALRDKYQQELNPQEQEAFRLYVAYLFVAGMVGRFWKGVGSPWPLNWKERAEVCTGVQRDKTMEKVLSQHAEILENYAQNYPKVLAMINDVYRVEIAFDLGRGQVFNRKIVDDIVKAQRGQFCLTHLSTILVSTALYLAQNVLGYTARKPDGGITVDTTQMTYLVNIEYLKLDPTITQFPITITGLKDTQHIDAGDVMREIEEQNLTFRL